VVDAPFIERGPRRLEFPLVNWLGPENMDSAARVVTTATFNTDGQNTLRWMRSWPESITGFEVLSDEDVKLAYKLLTDHNLLSDETKRRTWVEKSVA
jgi:hypothetical protein